MNYYQSSPLGKATIYKNSYDNSLLYSIKRNETRTDLNIAGALPFKGFDVWNCYELSWLDKYNKPVVRFLRLFIPCDSPSIVESKSLKLYLNSFSDTVFDHEGLVKETILRDISDKAGDEIIVEILKLDQLNHTTLSSFDGICLDDLELHVSNFDHDAKLLKLDNNDNTETEEILYTNLFKSNCPVTNQPDWASVQISYKGRKIDHPSLLRYIISFRNHNEFHENCVERIFVDIMNLSSPARLTVQAKYTRRGGIDINPIRSTLDLIATDINILRDVRQ